MSVAEITSLPTWQPIKRLVSMFAHLKLPSLATEYSESEDRARRTFILEMMDAHPDAFQHECDCQTLMGFYPSQF